MHVAERFVEGGYVVYAAALETHNADGFHAAVVVKQTLDGQAGSRDGWLSVVDYQSGELLTTVSGISNIRSMAFSPDGRTLITAHLDAHLRVWSFETLLKK